MDIVFYKCYKDLIIGYANGAISVTKSLKLMIVLE